MSNSTRVRRSGRMLRQWPYALVWLGLLAGAGLVLTEYWRRGLVVIGLVTIGAGVMRWLLGPRHAGWLIIRGKLADVTFCSVVGTALIVLAAVVRS